MAAEAGGWHEEAEKLCSDEELMTAVGDRSIFNLDDINLDDILLDLQDTDIPGFGADTPSQGGLFSSGSLHSSAADGTPTGAVDASGGGVALPEGLLCDDIDVSQLEWLSNFCEESYSSENLDFITCNAGGNISFHIAGDGGAGDGQKMPNVVAATDAAKEEFKFRTSSPISVLEHNGLGLTVGISLPTSFSTTATSSSTSSLSSPTSSSCSGVGGGGGGGGDSHGKMMMAAPRSPPEPIIIIPGRSRSKRHRPASFSQRPPIIIPVPPSETGDVGYTAPFISDELDNFDPESYSADQMQNTDAAAAKKKKKKKRALPPTTVDGEEAAESSPPTAPVRKCMHCDVTKTPQWRAGPMGPKTLCNACGVRYKSGRLFPEYRPAASPTFLASVHSNSHKKVVEMRNKVVEDTAATKHGGRRQDVASKACELLEYIRRRDWGGDEHRRITAE